MIKKLLNLGISEKNTENLNRRIKITNFSAVFSIIAIACCTPFYLAYQFYFMLYVMLSMMFIAGLTLFFNHLKKYALSICMNVFVMMGLLILMSLYFGLEMNLHLYLICYCMSAFILFENNHVIRNCTIGLSTLSFFSSCFTFKVTAVSVFYQ